MPGYLAFGGGVTQGSETSQYLEEKKLNLSASASAEVDGIPLVVESERGRA